MGFLDTVSPVKSSNKLFDLTIVSCADQNFISNKIKDNNKIKPGSWKIKKITYCTKKKIPSTYRIWIFKKIDFKSIYFIFYKWIETLIGFLVMLLWDKFCFKIILYIYLIRKQLKDFCFYFSIIQITYPYLSISPFQKYVDNIQSYC